MGKNRSKMFCVRVAPNQFQAYKMGAEMLEMNMKQLICRAVEDYLFKHLKEYELNAIFQATYWVIEKR